MKVVLLAGGKGTRISEESVFRPKPMIEIGGMPILWHIMKQYSFYGFNEFIVCAGYKQDYIKSWFNDYFLRSSDVTFDFTDGKKVNINHSYIEPWRVTVVDTGMNTMTGGRVRRIKEYIGNESFMLTYGDAVCDVDIKDLVSFHQSHGKMATMTSVIQRQSKGVLEISSVGEVKSFREKRTTDGNAINAGYMVLNPEVFDYLKGDRDVLETTLLEKAADENKLMSYIHNGFWQCMDSMREKVLLEEMWNQNKALWAKWRE